MNMQSKEEVKEVVVSEGLTSHERNLTINRWLREGWSYTGSRSIDSEDEEPEEVILIFKKARMPKTH